MKNTDQGKRWESKFTFNSSLPYSVCVSESRNNVVGDIEGELEAISATIFEGECVALRIRNKWNRYNHVRAIRSDDCKACNLYFRF